MSVSRRADGRWLVRYKDCESGIWRQKSFRDESMARAWESEWLAAQNGDEKDRLTLGELTMLFYRSNPDKHPHTRRNVVYMLAGHEDGTGRHISGAGEFLRDKYAESLNRHDLERMRENFRARGTGNNTINKYQAYIRAILAWGVDQDLISVNPWRDYKRLKTSKTVCKSTINDLRRLYPYLPDYLQWAVKTAFFGLCVLARSSCSVSPGTRLTGGAAWS